jgi:hypothetical protein
MSRRYVFALGCIAGCALSSRARAGGLEYPDNGTEAMGRGAAFTAKADDGTALIYNVAGFARQRGLRLTLGTNVTFHTATFQRSGVYPDSGSDKFTPWGGQPFPLVTSTGSPLPVPHLVLSSDLGSDRLTLAAGMYVPSVITGRSFPLVIDGKPSPARYDTAASPGKGGAGFLGYPTVAGAFRVTDWLDLGIAASYVVANLAQSRTSSFDLAEALCPNQEYQPCDTRQFVQVKGGATMLAMGALVRPFKSLAIGAQFRTGYTIEARGIVELESPRVVKATFDPGEVNLSASFPWLLRTGVRYIGMDEKREAWDVEANVTYEAWGSVSDSKVFIPKLGPIENIRTSQSLGFEDVMSLRVGGAYNLPINEGSNLALRGGFFRDGAGARLEKTALSADMLAKTGITAGLGYKTGAFTFNLALAKIFHESREVTEGTLRPTNASKDGQTVNSLDKPYDAVNNGTYEASTFVLSTGMTIELDELFGGKRKPPSFGAEYEVTASSEPDTKPTEADAKPAEESIKDEASSEEPPAKKAEPNERPKRERAVEEPPREEDPPERPKKRRRKKASPSPEDEMILGPSPSEDQEPPPPPKKRHKSTKRRSAE